MVIVIIMILLSIFTLSIIMVKFHNYRDIKDDQLLGFMVALMFLLPTSFFYFLMETNTSVLMSCVMALLLSFGIPYLISRVMIFFRVA